MGREEQVEEREVLDSIFPDEITYVSETEFRISIELDIPDHTDDEPPRFLLSVRYPDEYPDVAPDFDIMVAPDSGTSEFFSVSEDRDHLLASVQETIQESIGMAMVYTIVSALKETAEQLVQDRKDEVLRLQEERRRAAEQEENKKFQGTPVTAETFLKWREGFLKEMEEERIRDEEEKLAELKKTKVKEPVKLTGRQLWERGLAGKVDEGDDDDDISAQAEKLTIVEP